MANHSSRRRSSTGSHHATKKAPNIEARVLSPSEYPALLTEPRRLKGPLANLIAPSARNVIFAAQHPLGLYHVEDHGANVHAVYFTPRRAKNPQIIANTSSMAAAFRRISEHEDRLIHPEAAREEGKHGPVSIFALGKRTGEPKPKSQLDRELDAWLAANGYQT